MKESTIAYRNLAQEMQRRKISMSMLLRCMDCSKDTVTRRMARKTPLSLADAEKIRKRFFKDCTLEHLFSEDFEEVEE